MNVARHSPIVFFDGCCNLCNGSVRFLIRRDRKARISFASLQSEFARTTLTQDNDSAEPTTVVLLLEGREYYKSEAVVRIAGLLPWPWKVVSYTRYIPRRIRDAVYDFVARNRTIWFGRTEACMVPTPDLRSRFVDSDENVPFSAQAQNV